MRAKKRLSPRAALRAAGRARDKLVQARLEVAPREPGASAERPS